MANDIADLLANGMSNLRIPTDEGDEGRSFKLFPQLPTELRLKIWCHTLPTPALIPLATHIVVSDPTFGLYLTFSIANGHAKGPERHLCEERSISVLRGNRESRDVYLVHFPIGLPMGNSGQHRLYISQQDIPNLFGFSSLCQDRLFQRALREDYRLQTWWAQIEKLAIPVLSLIISGNPDWEFMPLLCRRLPALKELKAVMWEGFQDVVDNGNEERAKAIIDAMNAQLKSTEYELSCYVDEHGEKLDTVPRLELMLSIRP